MHGSRSCRGGHEGRPEGHLMASSVQHQSQRPSSQSDREPRHAASVRAPQRVAPAWAALRLRACSVWRVLGSARRQGDQVVRHPGRRRDRQADHNARGPPGVWARERGATSSTPELHPLQQAWIDLQVPHCGYCQSGMLIQAADLLAATKRPAATQIRAAMNGHLCRCGTYPRIVKAIQKAATVMAEGASR